MARRPACGQVAQEVRTTAESLANIAGATGVWPAVHVAALSLAEVDLERRPPEETTGK